MKKIALGISKVDLMPASYFTTFDPYFTGIPIVIRLGLAQK